MSTACSHGKAPVAILVWKIRQKVEDINQLSLKEILEKYDFVPIPTEKLGDNTNAKISQLYIEGELEIISSFISRNQHTENLQMRERTIRCYV